MIRINDILDKVDHLRPEGLALIQKAYVYSATAHRGQVRRSGEPYLSHPLEVANILAEIHMDEATICAALLHDTVEDTESSVEDIDALFGEEVADIVDGVTKLSQIQFDSKEVAQAESFRKMILAMADNIRVLIVKLADRLHNMRTLEHMPGPKQQVISQETMDIYAPLANRLGLHRIKIELEDLSLKYTKPDIYEQIHKGVTEYRETGKEYIELVVHHLEKMLKKNKIKGRIFGRTKHINSIHRKMVTQNLPLEDVHDIVAFRVLVGSIKDCYAVLGLVHSEWKPVHGRFKDYISMPKANMYQSLHTTVIGPDGERMEVQIRTEEMHRLAEHGVAAHWLYKDGGKISNKDMEGFAWLRQILDWQKEESDSREFMRSLRLDMFKDEVYVFTPNGDVRELPEGATPVDFAYLIHTEVGDHCNGAKVNGRLVPLSRPLINGDTVEIFTDAQRYPSRDWLRFVKTAKARTRIHHYIRTQERTRSIALAKEMLEKEGRKMSINFPKLYREHQLDEVAEEFSFKTVDDLLSAVGYSRITPRKVLHRIRAYIEGDTEPEREEHVPSPESARGPAGDSIVIQGVDDVLVRYAKCCSPLPGDAIVGYISRGKGVTVHTRECPNVVSMEPDRLLAVSWSDQERKAYKAKIRILCRNVKGVLGDISNLLAEEDVNIDSGSFHSSVDGTAEIQFTVEVRDSNHLYETNKKLNLLPTIIEATRASSTGLSFGK